jgi:hypothetical protein
MFYREHVWPLSQRREDRPQLQNFSAEQMAKDITAKSMTVT